MTSDESDTEGHADWVTVGDLARQRRVSHQAISKRVRALSKRGLATRKVGRALYVHRPSFDEIAAATHDPAQDLRNRHQKSAEPVSDPPPLAKAAVSTSAFDDASAREKNAKAALAEMQLAQKRGELVEASTIEAAAIEVATSVAQSIAALSAKFPRLYAAAIQGGEDGLRIELTASVDETLAEISEKISAFARVE